MAITKKLQWKAERLRLTAISNSPLDEYAQNWWDYCVGEKPESNNYQPKIGRRQIQIPYSSGQLLLVIENNRADWVLEFELPSMFEDDVETTVPYFDASLEGMKDLLGKWCQSPIDTTRLAFGATLLTKVNDRIRGYELLNDLLPSVSLDPEGSSDFHYRINRRRDSSVLDDAEINRLSHWSVASLRSSGLVVGPDSVKVLDGGVKQDTWFACRADLDINTAPEISERGIPKDLMADVFGELIEMAIDLSVHGDVK